VSLELKICWLADNNSLDEAVERATPSSSEDSSVVFTSPRRTATGDAWGESESGVLCWLLDNACFAGGAYLRDPRAFCGGGDFTLPGAVDGPRGPGEGDKGEGASCSGTEGVGTPNLGFTIPIFEAGEGAGATGDLCFEGARAVTPLPFEGSISGTFAGVGSLEGGAGDLCFEGGGDVEGGAFEGGALEVRVGRAFFISAD
jgi:hypothetical protein